MNDRDLAARVAAVKAATGLADLIGREVALVRRGREYVGLCPFHKERTPSFTVSEVKGFWKCFGCGAHGDAIGFVEGIEGVGFLEALARLESGGGTAAPVNGRARPKADRPAAEDTAGRRKAALEIWHGAKPIEAGDPVDCYLRGRALTRPVGGWPSALRFHASLRHPATGQRHQAMISGLSDVSGVISIQRTYLGRDEMGAWRHLRALGIADREKLTLGAPCAAAVRLAEPDLGASVEYHLGLAEGVESALSAMQLFGVPCWASTGIGRLGNVELHPAASAIVVYGERDTDPRVLARVAGAVRAIRTTGRRVRLVQPTAAAASGKGADFNDVVQRLASRHR